MSERKVVNMEQIEPEEMRYLRQTLGLSQERFAAAYGLNLQTVIDCEAGKTFPIASIGSLTKQQRDELRSRFPNFNWPVEQSH